MAYKTLGTLLANLRARLGAGAGAAAAGVNQTNLVNIVQEAQSQLYWTHDWARLRRYEDKALGVNQYLIDPPASAHPDRILALSVKDGTLWTPPLVKGIPPEYYTYQDNTTRPSRWEHYAQIELWPKADKSYTVRIFFIKNLEPFVDMDDEATLDDSLIFTLALADAKEHFRHPDARTHREKADALLTRLKGKSWGQTVFNRRDALESEALVKPRVV